MRYVVFAVGVLVAPILNALVVGCSPPNNGGQNRGSLTYELSPRGDFINEPSGFSRITERAFNAVRPDGNSVTEGWVDFVTGSSNLSLVQDASAPKSPPNVARLRYPRGFTSGGNSPGGSEVALRGTRRLYVAHWIKLSSNWQGHYSGVNKHYHIWVDGVNKVVAASVGEGSDPLQPQMRLQGLAGRYHGHEDANLSPNLVPSALFARGVWHKWETVLYAGTPGNADGTVDFYLDGRKIGSYSGIPFVRRGGSSRFSLFKWDPTWGGVGGPAIAADQYMYLDHIYISGK